MAFEIIKDLARQSEGMFYSPEFRAIVEDHLSILKTVGVTQQAIPLELYWQYEGNFYGYLTYLNIPQELHWLHLRVNGFDHPNEFAKAVSDPLNKPYIAVLLRPSETIVGDLQKYYLSRRF